MADVLQLLSLPCDSEDSSCCAQWPRLQSLLSLTADGGNDRSSRKEAVQLLQRWLEDDQRCCACADCRPQLLPALSRLLSDEQEAMRQSAVSCLSLLAAAEAGRVMALCCKRLAEGAEKAEELRTQLALLLSRCLQQLAACAPSPSASASVPQPQLQQAVASCLSDSCPAVKVAACRCLSQLSLGSALSPLCSAALLSQVLPLLRLRLELRQAALQTLAAVVPLLAATQREGEDEEAERGLRLPCELRVCLPLLSSLLADEKLRLRDSLCLCLLSWTEPGRRRWAEQDAVWLLCSLMAAAGRADEDAGIRQRAAGRLQDWQAEDEAAFASHLLPAVFCSLTAELSHWTAAVRLRACWSLQSALRLRPPASLLPPLLAPLTAALVDDERSVREAARGCAESLSRLLPPAQLLPAACLQLQQSADRSGRGTEAALTLLQLCLQTADAALLSAALPDVLPLLSSVMQSCRLLCSPLPAASLRWQSISVLGLLVDALPACMEPSGDEGSDSPLLVLFLSLHALDCELDEAQQLQPAGDGDEPLQLLTVSQSIARLTQRWRETRPASAADPSSLYSLCFPVLARSASLPGFLHLLRRCPSCLPRFFPSALSVLSDCLQGGDDALRSRCLRLLGELSLSGLPGVSAAQREAVVLQLLLPGCVWRSGAANAVIRLHALSCLHSALCSSRARGQLLDALLPTLRCHLDDEQPACRLLAARCLRRLLNDCAASLPSSRPACLLQVETLSGLQCELLHRLDEPDADCRAEAITAFLLLLDCSEGAGTEAAAVQQQRQQQQRLLSSLSIHARDSSDTRCQALVTQARDRLAAAVAPSASEAERAGKNPEAAG